MKRSAPTALAIPTLEEVAALGWPHVVGKRKTVRDVALDLSTRCVGWASGERPTLHAFGKLVFKASATKGAKLLAFEEFLGQLLAVLLPDRLLVEKPMSRRGDTTARHYELLGVVRKVWAARTSGEDLKESWIVAPKSVKRSFGVLRKGATHDENKQIMIDEINREYDLHLRFDRNSKLKSGDDAADAIAVMTSVWRRGGSE